MAEHWAFSEVRLQDDLDQELAFKIVLEEIEGTAKLLRDGAKSVTLNVFPFHDTELLKRMLIRKLKATSWLKISDLQIYYNGVELSNRRLLISFANQTESNAVTLQWKVREKLGQQMVSKGIRGVAGNRLSSKYTNWLESIIAAFQRNINPKLTDEGTGSSYILYNLHHKPVGIFKPQNEEAFCPYNPRGYVGRMGQKGFRTGVFSGEGWVREVAAYYLDAYYGSLSNVPPTLVVEAVHPRFCYDPSKKDRVGRAGGGCSLGEEADYVLNGLLRRRQKRVVQPSDVELSWKLGSLQMFVESHDCCGDYDASVFSVADVHKIGILDLRVCNMDRNEGNILVVREDQKFMDQRLVDLLDMTEFIQQHPRYQEQNLLLITNGASGGGGTSNAAGGGTSRQGSTTGGGGTNGGGGGTNGGGGGTNGGGGGTNGGGGGAPTSTTASTSGVGGGAPRKSKYRLIPIDHGLTLPDAFDITDFDLIWIRWPQARIGFSQDELEYIEKLKPDKDAEWLKSKLDLRPECLRTMQVSTRLLKQGAKLNLNLYQIAMCLVRLSPDQPSLLEQWVKLAITQTWYSCYQSNMVKQRSVGMNCIMDLAQHEGAVADRRSSARSTTKKTAVVAAEIHRLTSQEDDAAAAAAAAGSGSFGSGRSVGSASGKSRTMARTTTVTAAVEQQQRPADADLLLTRTAQKLRNYTNWRKSTTWIGANESIWSIEDVGGRLITLDWHDPRILRRFLDAFDNILSLRMLTEVAERHF